MNKTLEKQLNKLTLEKLFIIAQELDRTFWTYEDLKDFAIDLIKDDFLNAGTHIFNTLNTTLATYYHYDVIKGLFEEVAPITTKEEFINYLEDYNEEDIQKSFKKLLRGIL